MQMRYPAGLDADLHSMNESCDTRRGDDADLTGAGRQEDDMKSGTVTIETPRSGTFRSWIRGRGLPIAIILGISAAAVGLSRSMAGQQDAGIIQRVHSTLRSVEPSIALSLIGRARAVDQLVRTIESNGTVGSPEWNSTFVELFQWNIGVLEIAWLDPEGAVVWRHDGNQTADLPEPDLLLGLESVIPRMEDSRAGAVVGPVFVDQAGDRRFAIARPIGPDSPPNGFVLSIHSLGGLIDWGVGQAAGNGVALTITAPGQTIYESPAVTSPLDAELNARMPVSFTGVDWTLAALPLPELLAAERSYAPQGILGGGLLMAIMLGLVASLVQSARDAARQQEESDAFFRSVFDNALDPMMVLDGESRMVDVNLASCFLHGKPRSELIGRSFYDFAPLIGQPERDREWKRLLHEGHQRGNIRIARAAGEFREVECAATANISPGRHLAIYRDVTEQIEREHALGESEERYRDLFENASDLIFIISPNGQIAYANRSWNRALGYDDSELESLTVLSVVHKDFLSRFTEVLGEVAGGLQLDNLDIEFVAKDGRKVTVEGGLSAKIVSGQMQSIRGVFRDVTGQRSMEAELRDKNQELERQNEAIQQASRMKSEFLANMSHELRTPLNAIIGFGELLIDEHVGPITDEQRQCLDDVLNSSSHLLQLINDVLDLSKVEAGKMEFHPEAVDLEKVIDEVRDVLRSLSSQKRVSVDVSVDPGTRHMTLDPSRFKQVLYNYLSNALKFTPEDGHVEVSVVPEGDESFRLEVADSGIGIASDDLEKLFTEFQQLDSGTSKKYQGTGLGLALTRRLVEAQDGRVAVHSTLGKGSTFGAVLPRHSTANGYGSDRPGPAAANQKAVAADAPSILVVEDERKERASIVRTLTEGGYAVDAVGNGADALARIEERKYDGVTLDLLLPDMSGWDVLRAMRQRDLNKETPVLVVTLVSERGSAVGFHVHDFLTKPVGSDQLLDSVRRIVEQPAGALMLVGQD
jgi:PAS domain S-box-containing protein